MIYQHCMALAVSFMRHYITDFMCVCVYCNSYTFPQSSCSSNSMHVRAVRNYAVARVTINNQ